MNTTWCCDVSLFKQSVGPVPKIAHLYLFVLNSVASRLQPSPCPTLSFPNAIDRECRPKRPSLVPLRDVTKLSMSVVLSRDMKE